MTLHLWQPSPSPARRSQRLFCFLQALQAFEVLGRFGRDGTNEDGEMARLIEVSPPMFMFSDSDRVRLPAGGRGVRLMNGLVWTRAPIGQCPPVQQKYQRNNFALSKLFYAHRGWLCFLTLYLSQRQGLPGAAQYIQRNE